MRWRYILSIVGTFVFFLGLAMAFPLAWGLYFRDRSVFPLLIAMSLTMLCGGVLYASFRKERAEVISHREGMAIVTVSWTAVGLGVNVAVLPELGDGHTGLTPTSVAEQLGPGDDDDRLVALAGGFARGLRDAIASPAPAVVRWRGLLLHSDGDPVRVRLSSGETVTGELEEVTADGHLRVRTDAGSREITSGDVVE